MKETTYLIENPLQADRIDLVVGIPSYNEADNIAFVAEQAAQGLKKYFPRRTAALINADNFSKDHTKEAFLSADTGEVQKVYLSTPPGVRGKGNNFLNLFSYLAPFEPGGVIVVDADLKSITPEWIKSLGRPALGEFDFISPCYSRNEYDGTITNHLCYPMLYGVLGRNIRQPIGGDFAFSGRMMEHWLTRKWTPSIRQYGVDIFMTLEAVLSGYELAQVALGAKVHKPSAPKLGAMFTQVVDTLFRQLLKSREKWTVNGAAPTMPPILNRTEDGSNPQPLGIDYKTLKRQALEEFRNRREVVLDILPRQTRQRVKPMFERRRLRINRALWAETVFSFLRGYERAKGNERLDVVEALKPLYFARVVSFIRETLELDHAESEERILRQARLFRRRRKSLLSLQKDTAKAS